MEYSARNKFVARSFDRLAIRRVDDSWRRQVLADDRALMLPLWRHKVPATPAGEPHFLKPSDIRSADLSQSILLGVWNGLPCFSIDLGQSAETPPELVDLATHGLRNIGALAPAEAAALAAYAQAMVFWHRSHRYCGLCGQRNGMRESGHVLTCMGEACGSKQFPRSDPAVIVLVTRGDKALLGRQSTWPAGVYSTIAGFVEPGESLENAVRREVTEETGVTVDEVFYHSSQPWPFPASLMLGFHATATGAETVLRDDELEDVRWFTRAEIVAQLNEGMLSLSAPISIAYRLIEHWFDAGDAGALAAHIAAIPR